MRTKSVSVIAISLLSSVTFLVGCGKSGSSSSSSAADTSASAAAAGAAGGALGGSGAGGTSAMLRSNSRSLYSSIANAIQILPSALATNSCQTFRTTGAGCAITSGSMWLSYSACSFGNSLATWNGTQKIEMSSGVAACGTFPNPGASNYLVRQFVSASLATTPGSATRTAPDGVTVTVDDGVANLANFDGQTIPAIANGGYGTKVTLNGSGGRSAIQIGHRIYSTGNFDHSVSGSLNVTETAGAGSRTVSGSVVVFHNVLKVVGTSTFNSVSHTDTCCLPVSGFITTAFAAGANVAPTTAGSAFVGKTETLTFTGCGSGTLTDTTGASKTVTLNHCI